MWGNHYPGKEKSTSGEPGGMGPLPVAFKITVKGKKGGRV